MSSKNVTINQATTQQAEPQSTSSKPQPLLITTEEPNDDLFVQNVTQLIANSVMLNKKLHRQIVEKQYHMKTQNQEVSQKMNSFLRQMEELYHKTQSFYQETVRQNQKARFLTEELIKPFRQELRHKVDQTTLSLKMKLVLAQFDTLGHKISYDQEGKVKTEDPPSALQFIKKDLLPIIASLQSKINVLEINDEWQQKKIDQNFIKQSQIQSKISFANIQIEQIKKKDIISKQKEQILRQQMAVTYKKLNENLAKNNQELNTKIQTTKKETNDLKAKLQKATLFSKPTIEKVHRPNQDKYIDQMKQIIFQSLSEVKKEVQQLRQQANKRMEQMNTSKAMEKANTQSKIQILFQDTKKIKESLAQFLVKVQEQALNNLNKSIISKVHKLQVDNRNFQALIKVHEQKMNTQQKEIISVKNLLAQKANFSDFVRIIQMKADKEDYRYLQDLIHQTGSFSDLKQPQIQRPSSSFQQNSSFIGFKLRNKKILANQRKIQSGSTSPMLNSNEKQDSVKKYMLGLDSPPKRRNSKDRPKLLFVTQSQKVKWGVGRKDGSEGEIDN